MKVENVCLKSSFGMFRMVWLVDSCKMVSLSAFKKWDSDLRPKDCRLGWFDWLDVVG